MTLRELINKLEKLSNNGMYDNCRVETWPQIEGKIDGNYVTTEVLDAYLADYVTPNQEYCYVQLETE